MTKLLLVPLLMGATSAWGADVTVAQLIGAGKVLEHDSVILANDKPHEADMCRGFSLTESQVKSFFRKAMVLDTDTAKRSYQRSPCVVQGHLLYQEQTFRYAVSAAGTGQIEVAPGRYVSFGCNTCQDLFDYGYVLPPAASSAATH